MNNCQLQVMKFNQLEVVAAKDDSDDVLADIVDITLHCGQHYCPDIGRLLHTEAGHRPCSRIINYQHRRTELQCRILGDFSDN